MCKVDGNQGWNSYKSVTFVAEQRRHVVLREGKNVRARRGRVRQDKKTHAGSVKQHKSYIVQCREGWAVRHTSGCNITESAIVKSKYAGCTYLIISQWRWGIKSVSTHDQTAPSLIFVLCVARRAWANSLQSIDTNSAAWGWLRLWCLSREGACCKEPKGRASRRDKMLIRPGKWDRRCQSCDAAW